MKIKLSNRAQWLIYQRQDMCLSEIKHKEAKLPNKTIHCWVFID